MTIGDGPAIPQELAEEAPAVAAAATATGEADPNAGSGDSSDYDVASARTLLREARREIDNVAIRNSPRSWKGGGIVSEVESPRGVLASLGKYYSQLAEQRRREDLVRQVEVQRRILRKAIKRNNEAGGTTGRAGRDGSTNNQQWNSNSHSKDHHHLNSPGGICSAISNVASYSDDDSDSSASSYGAESSTNRGVSEVLVDSPVNTATGSGLHVELHVPDMSVLPQRRAADSDSTDGDANDAIDYEEATMSDIVVEAENSRQEARSTLSRTSGDTGDGDEGTGAVEDGGSYDGDDDDGPENTDEDPMRSCPLLLDPRQMKSVAVRVLPSSLQYCRWKRLYSLARDGDSFETFLHKVSGWKRTLLVLTTSRGETLGAYADSTWETQHQYLEANFYGSAQACLFRVRLPDEDYGWAGGAVVAYKWTGANRYIQICDARAKLLALGGGGKGGDFGLCVEDDFSKGSTGQCETFRNEPLCGQDQFDIVDFECYGFPTGFA